MTARAAGTDAAGITAPGKAPGAAWITVLAIAVAAAAPGTALAEAPATARGSAAAAAPAAAGDKPPANLLAGTAAHGAALDPVFAHMQVARLGGKFTEEKHVALLARPLRSSGTIHFDRDKGIARATLAPKPQAVVVTATSLRIRKDGRTDEVPLDKSKELRAVALIFPTLLRGARTELENSFEIGLYGSAGDWWALAFTPKTDALRKLVRKVVVFGKNGDVVALQVTEASGDVTDTHLTEIRTNGAVSDAEIATAFGAA